MRNRFLSIFALISAIPAVASTNSEIRENCARIFFSSAENSEKDAKRALELRRDAKALFDRYPDWRIHAEKLGEGVTPHSRQPLVLRPGNHRDKDLRFVPVAGNFRETRYTVGSEPTVRIPDDATVLRKFEFGYDLADRYRSIGPIDFIVTGADGRVLEIGGGSEELLGEFRRHLVGEPFDAARAARIEAVNAAVFSELAESPVARKKVQEFAQSRKWPEGIAQTGGLVYFSPEILNLEEFARRRGFTAAEMRDAGWLALTFDHAGHPHYRVNTPDTIKIPYFTKNTGGAGRSIPVWRTRNLKKGDPKVPKYVGWQLDRAIDRVFTVPERLYNGSRLAEARGKRLIITEGEFKSLVAERASGILTVGLPGITEFDDAMLKEIVDSGASEFLVALDRDPRGKALMRADGITDSGRAAYTIAKDLEFLGAKNVKVVTLPNALNGAKLGIDDLVLAFGPEPLNRALKEALKADDYAAKIGLDPLLHEVMRRTQKLAKAIEKRKIRNGRAGITADVGIARATPEVIALTELRDRYLAEELNGARSIDEAAKTVTSIRRIEGVPDARFSKRITLANGESVPLDRFTNDLIYSDSILSGLANECLPAPCSTLPFTPGDLKSISDELAAFRATGTLASHEGTLGSAVDTGMRIAKDSGFDLTSPDAAEFIVLSSSLAETFPLDEYRYVLGGTLFRSRADQIEMPLTVFKKDTGRAVAFASLNTTSAEVAATGKRFDRVLGFLRAP